MNSHGRKFPPDWLLWLALAAGIFLWQRTAFPPWMVDLFHIQYAAYEWSIGEPQWMYTPLSRYAEWIEHRAPVAERLGAEGDPNPHLYAPFLAAALAPLSHQPAARWRDTLLAINIALLLVFAWLIVRVSAGEGRTWRAYLWALALVLIAYPMARATKLGQIVPLQAAVLWWGILQMQRGREAAGGVAVGLVAALKMFPVGLAIVPVLGKRYTVAAFMLLTVAVVYGLSLLSLGVEVHRCWWEAVSEFGSMIWPFFGNQSFPGWMSRLVLGHGMLEPTPISGVGVTVLKLAGLVVFGGVTLFALYKVRARIGNELLIPAMGLVLSGMILAIPNSWEHYWMYVLPALGWAIHRAWSAPAHAGKVILGIASFFFLMKLTRFYGDSLFGQLASGSQTVGMLLFWLWLLRWMLRRSAPASAS